jgi:uncharacterized membrane protein (DUF4010 family)
MHSLIGLIRPQVLAIIIAVGLIAYFTMGSLIPAEAKGGIVGGTVSGLLLLGKDIIAKSKED